MNTIMARVQAVVYCGDRIVCIEEDRCYTPTIVNEEGEVVRMLMPVPSISSEQRKQA